MQAEETTKQTGLTEDIDQLSIGGGTNEQAFDKTSQDSEKLSIGDGTNEQTFEKTGQDTKGAKKKNKKKPVQVTSTVRTRA